MHHYNRTYCCISNVLLAKTFCVVSRQVADGIGDTERHRVTQVHLRLVIGLQMFSSWGKKGAAGSQVAADLRRRRRSFYSGNLDRVEYLKEILARAENTCVLVV